MLLYVKIHLFETQQFLYYILISLFILLNPSKINSMLYFFLSLGRTCGTWKFPGPAQGTNPHRSSDNAGSLTCWATQELINSILLIKNRLVLFFFFFFFSVRPETWNFLGQGSNPSHNSDPSCCSENTGSLTCCTTRNSSLILFCNNYFIFLYVYIYREMSGVVFFSNGNSINVWVVEF